MSEQLLSKAELAEIAETWAPILSKRKPANFGVPVQTEGGAEVLMYVRCAAAHLQHIPRLLAHIKAQDKAIAYLREWLIDWKYNHETNQLNPITESYDDALKQIPKVK